MLHANTACFGIVRRRLRFALIIVAISVIAAACGGSQLRVAAHLDAQAISTARHYVASEARPSCGAANPYATRELHGCQFWRDEIVFWRQPAVLARKCPGWGWGVRGGVAARFGWKAVRNADCVVFRGGGDTLYLWLDHSDRWRVAATAFVSH